jgi:hypothetical protein
MPLRSAIESSLPSTGVLPTLLRDHSQWAWPACGVSSRVAGEVVMELFIDVAAKASSSAQTSPGGEARRIRAQQW